MLVVPPRSELRTHPVETSRMLLTPIEAVDAKELFKTVEASRSHLERFLPWVPFTADAESSLRFAEASSIDWDNARACRFAMRDRASKRFLGVVGLEDFTHLHRHCKLGYWLRVDATKRGYMTEGAKALISWGFTQLHAHRISVAAATDNHASLGVIGRLGFYFEGIARQAERCQERWLDHAQFSMLASEWPGL